MSEEKTLTCMCSRSINTDSREFVCVAEALIQTLESTGELEEAQMFAVKSITHKG